MRFITFKVTYDSILAQICRAVALVSAPKVYDCWFLQRDGPRRPLPYQIVDISDPVKTHHVPQLKTPQRVLPPLPQPPCHQAGPERPLPANPTLRLSQVTIEFLSTSVSNYKE